jgi:multicomponent Na+:H+ antiporter subunit B
MTGRHESVIVGVVTRLAIPFIQMFAFYVIAHGHYSAGGGFQGGVLLAMSTVLPRIVFGAEESRRQFSTRAAITLAGCGVMIYFLTGVAGLLYGGSFLDYGALAFLGEDHAIRRYLGILIVETGIGFGVWGALVTVYDQLLDGAQPV